MRESGGLPLTLPEAMHWFVCVENVSDSRYLEEELQHTTGTQFQGHLRRTGSVERLKFDLEIHAAPRTSPFPHLGWRPCPFNDDDSDPT